MTEQQTFLAIVERQAILNHIRALCDHTTLESDGRPVVLTSDILAALNDPGPLG